MQIQHDPNLIVVSFFVALALLIALAVLLVWLRSRHQLDTTDVPCGAYGICQRRVDCHDHYCEAHPAKDPARRGEVIQFRRRQAAAMCRAPERKE